MSHLARGILHCSRLGAASFASKPARDRFVDMLYFGGVFQIPPKLRRVHVSEFLPNELKVELGNIHTEQWQVSTMELATITKIAKARDARHIFEIGTFDGRTTLNLHYNCPEATIHTVDLPPDLKRFPGGIQAGQLFKDALGEANPITQIYCNSQTYDFSAFYGSQDLIFIDADHEYNGVKIDTNTALRLLQGREGIIIWHDYAAWPGVTQCLHEVSELIASDVDLFWIKDTSLAVLMTKEGQPLRHRLG